MSGYFDYDFNKYSYNYSSYDVGYPSYAWNSYGGYNDYSYLPSLFEYAPSYYSYGWDTWTPTYSYGNNFGASRYSFDKPYKTTFSLGDFGAGSKSFGSLTSSSPSVYRGSGKISFKPVAGNVKRKLGPEFLARVKEVARNINCDYKDLLAVMNSESGLDSTIQNQAGYRAYGLIQFTPDTASGLGTTVEALVRMSPVKQLDYVEKFYLNARKDRGFGNKKFTAADLYAITFLPARSNRDVLCVRGERWESGKKKGQLKNWYEANTVFDKNKDGKIEKSELQEQMNACRVNENIFVA